MLEALPVTSSTAPIQPAMAPMDAQPGDLPPVSTRVKWFDATRGFGFLVSDDIDGDILVHFSVLREHGRRNLPEGAIVECIPTRMDRGLQARKVLSIDSSNIEPAPRPAVPSARKADREALSGEAGPFEPVEVKWFNRSKGFGFVIRSRVDADDVFVHMETARQSGVGELQQGQLLEARIAKSSKGLTAVELRLPS